MSVENDLLQKFIDNEKKSKTWTLFSVLAFCVVAFGLIYLAARLKKATNQLNQRTQQLNAALVRADSLNDSLNQKIVILNRLSRERDSLIGLLPRTANMSDNKIVQTLIKGYAQGFRYKVYIQYTADYKSEAEAIPAILPADFYAPELEKIDRFSFSSTIKYFNSADKDGAQQLADLVNTRIAKFKNNPIQISLVKSSVPKGQIELWLGKYEKLNTHQMLQKYKAKASY